MNLRYLLTKRALWRPLLPGATLSDRLGAALASMAGIILTGAISGLTLRHGLLRPDIVAPIGASAVLVFAAPASPLAQPWSAFGGNVVSGLAALAVCHEISEPYLAIGLSVGLAILAMSLLRCLHPPGGAVALLTALSATQAPDPVGLAPLTPIALNTALLVGCAWVYHRLVSGHSWPHHPPTAPTHGTTDPAPSFRYALRDEDIDAAVADMHESFDISREDLAQVLRQVELRAYVRAHGEMRCADIMSRDFVTARVGESLGAAAQRAATHRLSFLPVVDAAGHVVGGLDAPELARAILRPEAGVEDELRAALTAAPGQSAFALLGPLSEGSAHGACIVDAQRRLVGVVTQTDLLAAMAQAAALEPAK